MEESELSESKQKLGHPSDDKPWLFKPGQSGNLKGRPPGSKTLKTYAKEYLASLTDEDKLEYLAGMDKKIVWEMAEGKAKQDLDVSGEVTAKIISIDE